MSNNKNYNPQAAKNKRIEETLDILSQVLIVHKRIKARTAMSVLYTMRDILFNNATVMVEDQLDGMVHVDIINEENKNKKNKQEGK